MQKLLRKPLSNAAVVAIILSGTLVINALLSELRPSCSITNGPPASSQFRIAIRNAIHSGSKPRSRITSNEAIAYDAIARHNLEEFKTSLLAQVLPLSKEADYKKVWPTYKPIIQCPAGRPLTVYGGGRKKVDGQKWLCKVPARVEGSICVIYSLGSNGDFSFEEEMLKASSCDVHTFDCTYKQGTSLDNSHRHFYHEWCIGDPTNNAGYRTWANITATLGHSKVDILKMDIEGHEFSVLSTFHPEDNLPDELSMEIHIGGFPAGLQQLALTFLHLANLGYAAYSQELNYYYPHCCAEFSFMRFA